MKKYKFLTDEEKNEFISKISGKSIEQVEKESIEIKRKEINMDKKHLFAEKIGYLTGWFIRYASLCLFVFFFGFKVLGMASISWLTVFYPAIFLILFYIACFLIVKLCSCLTEKGQ